MTAFPAAFAARAAARREIPPAARDQARLALLDTAACLLAGRGTPRWSRAETALRALSPRHPDTLTVDFADGSSIAETVAEVSGGHAQPLDARAITGKYVACGGSAAHARAFPAAPGEGPISAYVRCTAVGAG